MNEARAALRHIASAVRPSDLFGVNDGERARRAARRTVRVLGSRVHPDRAAFLGIDATEAAAAFARLGELHRAWLADAGTDADPSRHARASDAVVTGRNALHRLGEPLATGTWATLYTTADSVAKVARSEASGRLAVNAATHLTRLADLTRDAEHAWLRPYYPRLLDVGEVAWSTGSRAALVMDALGEAQGFVTLERVLASWPGGLNGRDWAWMMRRLLRAVAGAHAAGVVHGAILPSNVLIHPAQHGVVLAGWGMATTPGRPLPARVASHLDAYPPERDGAATEASDVWMLAQLMTTALRPREAAALRFARGCRQVAPRMRPTALDLIDEYDDLLERTYGPRTFRPFTVPATAGAPATATAAAD